MEDVLFHISDVPTITCFEPRPNPRYEGSMVWAVDKAHVFNYFLPRACPRVTFYPLPLSDPADVERLMGWSTASHVIAIESHWLPEVARHCLYQYTFAPKPFECIDAGAGYYIARETIKPLAMMPIPNLLDVLVQHNIELRIMPSLWRLREMVIASSLQFSIIRMRNAQPPSDGYERYHPL